MPKLENWSVIQDSDNPFLAPELRAVRLVGIVYGHDRINDGTIVRTSSLQKLNTQQGYALTRNTDYELGTPSDDFVKWLDSNGHELEDYRVGL